MKELKLLPSVAFIFLGMSFLISNLSFIVWMKCFSKKDLRYKTSINKKNRLCGYVIRP